MTEKQKIFCAEYLKDLNATRAYKATYKNVKSDSVAAAAAARLLRNVKVKAYVEQRLEELHSKRTADVKEIVEYLTAVMRGEAQSEELILRSVGRGGQRLERVMKTPSEREKLQAAQLLGKRFGMFTERIEADVKPSGKLADIFAQLGGDGLDE